MAALSKKNFRLWGYGKVFVLFAGCLLFSVSGRLNEGIYFEQHILSAVSDHYYLTCFLLPVLLLSCFSFLEDDGENVILRFQSYHSYFYRKWLGTGGTVSYTHLDVYKRQAEDVEKSRRAGMNAHISKPVSAGELYKQMKNFSAR